MWKTDIKRFGGSGFINFKNDVESMPERANGEGNEDMNSLGGEYLLLLEIFGAPSSLGKKFSGFEKTSTLNKKCTLSFVPQADGLSGTTYQTKGNEFSYEPPGQKILVEKNAKKISGESTFNHSNGVVGTVKWNYLRIE
jgi:hypothetical protein